MKSATNSRSHLATYLKRKRQEVGLTQSQVAEKLGYSSPQFVSNWERGLANPPVFILKNLTKLYRVSPDEMFGKILEQVQKDLYREFHTSKRG